jgi:hypothetical protein
MSALPGWCGDDMWATRRALWGCHFFSAPLRTPPSSVSCLLRAARGSSPLLLFDGGHGHGDHNRAQERRCILVPHGTSWGRWAAPRVLVEPPPRSIVSSASTSPRVRTLHRKKRPPPATGVSRDAGWEAGFAPAEPGQTLSSSLPNGGVYAPGRPG